MEEDIEKLCSQTASDTGSVTSLQHVSLLNSGITTKEQLKIYCKLTYKFRTQLKNKRILIVLLWIYLVASAFFYIKNGSNTTVYSIELVALGLTLPLAGWLADIWLGRYTAIRFSMWIMWIAVVLITGSSVMSQFVDGYRNISSYMQEALTIIAYIGCGVFFANIVQFGLDQLHDASTNEITSFIIWLAWTLCITGYISYFAVTCVPTTFSVLGNLVICISLSTALTSMFTFDHLLVKEPSNKNPFKLIYNVVKYAVKNKRPAFRSAFTYCEDHLPSRIDFGKSKYGGPFTTEQVEDVKTFFRIVVLIAIASASFGGHSGTELLLGKVYSILTNDDKHTQNCDYTGLFKQTVINCGAIVIPLYELIFYPFFYRCLAFIDSQRKVTLGLLFLVVTIVTLMILDTAARNNLFGNSNITNLHNHTLIIHSLDYRWIAIPCVFKSMSVALFGIGGVQFIASQAPYSMRGVIMGTTYGLIALLDALGRAVNIPFAKAHHTGVVSIGFWHGLLLLITEIVVGSIQIVAWKLYKKRKREDVLPNEHIFAERYYGTDN